MPASAQHRGRFKVTDHHCLGGDSYSWSCGRGLALGPSPGTKVRRAFRVCIGRYPSCGLHTQPPPRGGFSFSSRPAAHGKVLLQFGLCGLEEKLEECS